VSNKKGVRRVFSLRRLRAMIAGRAKESFEIGEVPRTRFSSFSSCRPRLWLTRASPRGSRADTRGSCRKQGGETTTNVGVTRFSRRRSKAVVDRKSRRRSCLPLPRSVWRLSSRLLWTSRESQEIERRGERAGDRVTGAREKKASFDFGRRRRSKAVGAREEPPVRLSALLSWVSSPRR
jgi:hypothetical protein